MCLLKHRCVPACRYALAYGAFGRGLCSVTSNRRRHNAERKCTKSRSALLVERLLLMRKDIYNGRQITKVCISFSKAD